MSALIRMIDTLSGSFGLLAAWVVAPLIIATVYEVFSRYVLNAPTIWAYEIAYMAMGANFLLGSAFTLRERAHIRIDVVYAHFAPKTKAVIDCIGYAFLLLPTLWWLTPALWDYALDAYISGETTGRSAWNPVAWPHRLIFFVGILLLALQATAELIKAAYTLLGKDVPGPGR
jgi:TRAP-type mannitol/chloroaromatic compound transport system permease small subunit